MDRSGFINNLQRLAQSQFNAQVQLFHEHFNAKDALIAQLQQQLADKDATIFQLRDDISASREQVSSRDSIILQLQQQSEVDQRNIQFFRKQLKQSARGNENLRIDLQTYTLALGKTKDTLTKTKSDMVLLEKSNKCNKRLLNAAEEKLKDSEHKIMELESKLKQSQARIDSLENTLMWHDIVDTKSESFTIFEDSVSEKPLKRIAVDPLIFCKKIKRLCFVSGLASIAEQPDLEEESSLINDESFQAVETNTAISVKQQVTSKPRKPAVSARSTKPKQIAKKKVKCHFSPLFTIAAY